MNKKDVAFTIITVVYNDVDNIEKTINSVINQSHDNIEYIIIDGGSTDGTVDVIKKYSDKISCWLSEPDNGIYDAMNKGLKLMNGEFVCFMNSADIFYNSNVVSLVNSIKNIDDYDFIYGDCMVTYPNDFTRLSASKPVRYLDRGMICSHQSIFTKATVFNNREFNLKLSITSDFELFYKSCKEGSKTYQINHPISIITSGGVSDIKRILCYKEYFSIVKESVSLRIKCYYFCQIIRSWIILFVKKILPNNLEAILLKLKYRKKNA